MNRQNEITQSFPLLDGGGRITEEGWARHPYWEYRRGDVKAPWWRIKEWDYYYVLSDDLKKGISFTISDLGYAGLMALCWIDLEAGRTSQADALAPLTRGRVTAVNPSDADVLESGVLSYESENLSLRFETAGAHRRLIFSAPSLDIGTGGSGVKGEIILEQPKNLESINIATSWAENRRRFYYNRKINCMRASGTVKAGNSEYVFRPETAFGGLDWGRGAWTYRNRWFWSSANGIIGGNDFGFNLGYGFSDRSPASENVLFYKGVAHKLGDVNFFYDEANYLAPWEIRDEDGRLNLCFTPAVDRFSKTDFLLIKSVQHQVFGRFSGTAVLDDGTNLELNGLSGFAEDVFNRW